MQNSIAAGDLNYFESLPPNRRHRFRDAKYGSQELSFGVQPFAQFLIGAALVFVACSPRREVTAHRGPARFRLILALRQKELSRDLFQDFLLGGAAGGGWYSVLKVRVKLAR